MQNHAPAGLRAPSLSQPDYNFAPDFAWAFVGGLVVLGVSALLYAVIVTWGGFRLDPALPIGPATPLTAYPRELAGVFMGGALVVLVARSLSTRTQ